MRLTLIHIIVALAFSAIGSAQPVIVQGPVGGPGGDPLAGTCEITPSASFLAADGKLVPNAPMTVPFSAGILKVALEPNDTGIPSGTSYSATCAAAEQSVIGSDGKKHTAKGEWIWTLYVRSAPNSAALSAVTTGTPPDPTVTVPWQYVNFSGLANGCFSILNGNASTFSCAALAAGKTWSQLTFFTWSQM